MGYMAGTYHSDGWVQLPDAHPARWVLAVEGLIWDEAAICQLHCWLCSMRVQVDELLTWGKMMEVSYGVDEGHI